MQNDVPIEPPALDNLNPNDRENEERVELSDNDPIELPAPDNFNINNGGDEEVVVLPDNDSQTDSRRAYIQSDDNDLSEDNSQSNSRRSSIEATSDNTTLLKPKHVCFVDKVFIFPESSSDNKIPAKKQQHHYKSVLIGFVIGAITDITLLSIVLAKNLAWANTKLGIATLVVLCFALPVIGMALGKLVESCSTKFSHDVSASAIGAKVFQAN